MHLDDDGELYALGLLEPDRSAAIEAHLTACDACRARVIAAEAAGAALATGLPPVPEVAPQVPGAAGTASAALRRWNPLTALATAAALVFASTAAIEGLSAHAASARLAATDGALLAIAGSHFNHVSLAGRRGVVAKALYARDGSWYFVVVHGAAPGAHVVLRSGTAARDVGALDDADPATIFVRELGRVAEIDVVQGGQVVARAAPAY